MARSAKKFQKEIFGLKSELRCDDVWRFREQRRCCAAYQGHTFELQCCSAGVGESQAFEEDGGVQERVFGS